MTRCPHPLLRYPLAFLFVVAAWFLLVPALDMPVQELQGMSSCRYGRPRP